MSTQEYMCPEKKYRRYDACGELQNFTQLPDAWCGVAPAAGPMLTLPVTS